MRWTSYLAIYFLFWFLSLFVVLPFGVKTAEEAGVEKVPGQADSAPANFQPWRIVARTSLVAFAVFAVFALNFRYEWLTMSSFDFLFNAPKLDD